MAVTSVHGHGEDPISAGKRALSGTPAGCPGGGRADSIRPCTGHRTYPGLCQPRRTRRAQTGHGRAPRNLQSNRHRPHVLHIGLSEGRGCIAKAPPLAGNPNWSSQDQTTPGMIGIVAVLVPREHMQPPYCDPELAAVERPVITTPTFFSLVLDGGQSDSPLAMVYPMQADPCARCSHRRCTANA